MVASAFCLVIYSLGNCIGRSMEFDWLFWVFAFSFYVETVFCFVLFYPCGKSEIRNHFLSISMKLEKGNGREGGNTHLLTSILSWQRPESEVANVARFMFGNRDQIFEGIQCKFNPNDSSLHFVGRY